MVLQKINDGNLKNVNRKTNQFIFSIEEEPHSQRRVQILQKYPQIKKLMIPEKKTKFLIFGSVALQLFLAYFTLDFSWPKYLLIVYVIGATVNHSLFLAIHELSHNLGFQNISHNRICAIFANMPIGIAYAMAFKPYHNKHHKFQGHDGIDTDIPSVLETVIFSTRSICYVDRVLRKFLFLFFQIFAYALRPVIQQPQFCVFDKWLALNWLVQCIFNFVMVYFFGFGIMYYFLLSTFFAASIHPTAGHFIAEHFVMDVNNTETYSYYGILNKLTYNVGYHNEHHDFPNIPWSKLPLVTAIAPEFYSNIPRCECWISIISKFIFDDNVTLFSRVKRNKYITQ